MIVDGIKRSRSKFLIRSCKIPNGDSSSRENNANEVIFEEGTYPILFQACNIGTN